MTSALAFSKFGKYDIVRKLGRSMTDVYLAFDPQANRRVVLKIVEHSRDSYTQTILEAERRGAAIQQELHRIDPRVLEIYEFGEQQGCFFVAMQYVEGRNLTEIVEQEGRLEARRAARYAAEVASQLQTLHSFQAEIDGRKRAVVHGDIKPSNIQIGLHDQVWLLDFGIAKATTASRNLTHHNLGSPAYCSPERLLMAQVDPNADLWALGVCLYEMVSGMPPYQAQTTRKLENLIQSRRPPRALPSDCPAPLRSILWKALAAEPERRYPSAAAFEGDLRAFLAAQPTTAEHKVEASWELNETVNKDQPVKAQATRPSPSMTRKRLAKWVADLNFALWTLLAGFLFGLLCFLPAANFYRYREDSAPLREGLDGTRKTTQEFDQAFKLYKQVARDYPTFVNVPALSPREELRASLMAAADRVLDSYRLGNDPEIIDFDWDKARACLSHIAELDPGDRAARAKLAVARGYLELVRGASGAALACFEEALAAQPGLADAHLGLARIYVYQQKNIGAALAELHAAEQAGYKPGPREHEQEADGYLVRAEQQLQVRRRAQIAQARRDLDRARVLYEPIAGFSRVSSSLERLNHDEAVAIAWQKALDRADAQRRLHARYRRWR